MRIDESSSLQEISQRDVYIEELELQLTDLRAQLLEFKLTCTDKDDFINTLQTQVATQD